LLNATVAESSYFNWLIPAPLWHLKMYQIGYEHMLISIWENKYVKWKFSKSDVTKKAHTFFLV